LSKNDRLLQRAKTVAVLGEILRHFFRPLVRRAAGKMAKDLSKDRDVFAPLSGIVFDKALDFLVSKGYPHQGNAESYERNEIS